MRPAFPLPTRAPRLRGVIVGNSAGETADPDVTLPACDDGPAVSGELQIGVAAPGQTLVISTTVAGEPPFAHQWLRNGRPIAGAAGVGDSPLLQLTTPVLTSADNGVRYSVVIASAAGSVRSPDAVIYVTDVNRIVAAGGSHSPVLSGRSTRSGPGATPLQIAALAVD